MEWPGNIKVSPSMFKAMIKFTRVSLTAESHCTHADSRGFSLVSFPRGRWERSVLGWSSKTGGYRGRGRNTKEWSFFSLGGR